MKLVKEKVYIKPSKLKKLQSPTKAQLIDELESIIETKFQNLDKASKTDLIAILEFVKCNRKIQKKFSKFF